MITQLPEPILNYRFSHYHPLYSRRRPSHEHVAKGKEALPRELTLKVLSGGSAEKLLVVGADLTEDADLQKEDVL